MFPPSFSQSGGKIEKKVVAKLLKKGYHLNQNIEPLQEGNWKIINKCLISFYYKRLF